MGTLIFNFRMPGAMDAFGDFLAQYDWDLIDEYGRLFKRAWKAGFTRDENATVKEACEFLVARGDKKARRMLKRMESFDEESFE